MMEFSPQIEIKLKMDCEKHTTNQIVEMNAA